VGTLTDTYDRACGFGGCRFVKNQGFSISVGFSPILVVNHLAFLFLGF